ncbi:PucR family transcriptional regulator [Actinomycetes bacterium M1A6_2h]
MAPSSASRSAAERVAADAAADAGAPAELLADFLSVLTEAVTRGTPLDRRDLRNYRAQAVDAARRGIALRALLDLYLSSIWRMWRELPMVQASDGGDAVAAAGDVMLRAADDVVAELTEGFQLARRSIVRMEESARREFVDDLLMGGGNVADMSARAAGFGLNLSGPHCVLVVRAETPFTDGTPVARVIERATAGTKGDAEAVVASKDGRLVVVFPSPDRLAIDQVVDAVCTALGSRPSEASVDLARHSVRSEWQIGVGRAAPGASGVVTSYRQAREALELAIRLKMTARVVEARDLLVHHVLLRDRDAISDLVETLLRPLEDARGGAEPLLHTLAAYFASGGNSASTARAMHLSVRAVTYRLARVRELTGCDVDDPAGRFALNTAVLGAQLLDWPTTGTDNP